MKKALVCASFGSTVDAARQEIAAVEQALAAAAPDRTAVRAFTSGTVRRVLARRGEPVPSLAQALEDLRRAGCGDVFVQPTHFLCGFEADALRAGARAAAGGFERLRVGRPLLASTGDLRALAEIAARQYPARSGGAVVLMGHGTGHFANIVYPALQTVFDLAGRPDIRVGTVEGWPGLEEVRAALGRLDVSRVCLAPLMLTAGDHALHDMAGEGPDSWRSVLEGDGFRVGCVLRGMGSLPEVQALYAARLKADLAQEDGERGGGPCAL